MRTFLLAGGLLCGAALLPGCATTKPLNVACVACSLLDVSGMCATRASALACESGHLEIVNYRAWSDGEEPPRIECRRVTIQ